MESWLLSAICYLFAVWPWTSALPTLSANFSRFGEGLNGKFIPLLLQGPCRDPTWGVWGGWALGGPLGVTPPLLTLFWADREEITLPTLERDV